MTDGKGRGCLMQRRAMRSRATGASPTHDGGPAPAGDGKPVKLTCTFLSHPAHHREG